MQHELKQLVLLPNTHNDCGGTYARTTASSGQCLDCVQCCKSATLAERRSSPRTSVKTRQASFQKAAKCTLQSITCNVFTRVHLQYTGQLRCPRVSQAPKVHLVKSASKGFLKTGRHLFTLMSLDMGQQRLFGSLKRHKVWVVISAR